ncbi:hypothetical protein ZIOFF_070093 [Zingiber officinale]|uniref:Uncharacterized protein n=1 Tax=Zingiber officinale TaxID=94328 RepID=A0A8J5CC49_ZINOF|nr:hypothetical protein ZIOFF_070093 [Zingiber officinale]
MTANRTLRRHPSKAAKLVLHGLSPKAPLSAKLLHQRSYSWQRSSSTNEATPGSEAPPPVKLHHPTSTSEATPDSISFFLLPFPFLDSNIIHEESRNESKKFHNPLKVRSCGRPPNKRKQSKIEQIVKRAKAKSHKKGSTIDRKQDELSNIEQIDKFLESQRLFMLDKELLVPNDVVQRLRRILFSQPPPSWGSLRSGIHNWKFGESVEETPAFRRHKREHHRCRSA